MVCGEEATNKGFVTECHNLNCPNYYNACGSAEVAKTQGCGVHTNYYCYNTTENASYFPVPTETYIDEESTNWYKSQSDAGGYA